MKKFRKQAVVISSIVTLLFLFGVWYKYTFSMTKVAAFQVNATRSDSKLLIATQGSEFKNNITQGVIDHYGPGGVFINVMDVSGLNDVVAEEYDAILVLHTWEYERPPDVVASFIDKMKGTENDIIVMSTSGHGTSKIQGVDAITGESILENVPLVVDKIIKRLDPFLK